MSRYAVLNKPVHTNRNLTSAEARALRAAGVSCSTAWVISPSGSGTSGQLYRPIRGTSSVESTGLHVFPA